MNIHILSNSPKRINSGFGIVTRNLAIGLNKLGYNVSVSDMQNVYDIERWNKITIYPLNSVAGATGTDFYINELKQLNKNLRDSKADILLIIYPSYDNVVASNHLHEIFPNTIWYYPVEGENIPSVYVDELSKVKSIVAMTYQGLTELEKTRLNNVYQKPIYHGFDPNNFYKLNGNDDQYCKWTEERYMNIQDKYILCKRGCFDCNYKSKDECEHYEEEQIVANLFGDEFVGNISNLSKLKDQFGVETIFGFVGENNGTRKMINRLLNAYSELQKSNDINKNDVMLLLHTLPDSGAGVNLWEYVQKYEITSNLLFVYGTDGMSNSWSERALNIFYNAIDINVSASSAEGFGLPTIESMACEKCNIAPNFSSFTELLSDNRGLLADIEEYQKTKNNMKRGLVSVKSLAECMKTLHHDKNLRNKLAKNGYKWVHNNCTWENICNQFSDMLNDVMYEKNKIGVMT